MAEFYEEDVQTALGAAMALIEPLILIIMAVFVGGDFDLPVYADLYPGSECALEQFQSFKGFKFQRQRVQVSETLKPCSDSEDFK